MHISIFYKEYHQNSQLTTYFFKISFSESAHSEHFNGKNKQMCEHPITGRKV